MAQEYEFHYDFMTDCNVNSNTYGKNADIFCRECDADMYDLAKMPVKVVIPCWEGENLTAKTVFGYYGKITDTLYKCGYRW